ncbi:RagB/SusD family nutrient uptake outer membrane protein [Mucilaginibacter flavidus]|uniref:RagB/SusD family nutrient uptake outer membrane protein n=1 Tax=Mucilaginibacter flavidus TaxID=2949309 RepID=UPI002092BC39|nr:RagB/SusD family nutrient uptake outer membrane protein [Mucilaginibacter flavidus]MCO5950989.1 RagB/SusD family nutrient uptake outer membrane protein [Mucilaginibacter flavidus]
MKNIKLFYILLCTGLLFLTSLISCKKFVDIGAPQTQAESTKVFSSDATATSAVVGLYYQMTANNLTFLNGAVTIYTGLSGDELSNVNPNSDYDAFKTNAIPSNNSTINSKFWSNAYKYIYQANTVLEGLQNSATITDTVKNQLRGEMLFSRALNYFYLVNLFGDVPLISSTDYTINGSIPRTSTAKVDQQIIADLTEAKQLLTKNYSTSTNVRPNQMAAAALLARVYLYQKDWVNAEAQATALINSGAYSLENDLNKVFNNSSVETIFQLARPTSNTAEGSVFIPGSTFNKPTFIVTNALLNSFENGDKRKIAWLKSNTISGTSYYYPYKYKIRNSTTVTEYYVVLRLAEIYLIRAEARAEQQKLNEALSDLNLIRNRAGLPNTNVTVQTDVLDAIMHERQVELFAEWGHRWLDLKRTGQANNVLSAFKGANWQPADALYPVPLSQIQLNPFLTQNNGY